jgi:hypothetical protein
MKGMTRTDGSGEATSLPPVASKERWLSGSSPMAIST